MKECSFHLRTISALSEDHQTDGSTISDPSQITHGLGWPEPGEYDMQ